MITKIKQFITEHKVVVSIILIMFIITLVIAGFVAVKIAGEARMKKNNGPAIGQAEDNKKTEDKKPEGYNSELASLPACPSGKELFTTFPVAEGEYKNIVPLGNLNPSSHTFPTDHIYVEVHDPQNPGQYPVSKQKALLSPADMRIYAIQSSEEVGGITDWAMDFSPCRDVKGKFGHVGSISEKLKAEIDKQTNANNCNQYQTGGHTYKSCQYNNLKIEVKAGEVIGTAGSARSGMLDIWMSDFREPQVKRANQSRWSADRNYVSCFLDYYKTAQKDLFYGFLLGPSRGVRTKEPRCGTVEVDIAGTAQGVWFYNLTGPVQNEDPHLALSFDNIETERQVFSVGNSTTSAGITGGAYWFVPKTSGKVNRDFSQVTADSTVYCYDTKNGREGGIKSILLSMPSSDKLRLSANAGSCGAGPWTMTNYVEFAR